MLFAHLHIEIGYDDLDEYPYEEPHIERVVSLHFVRVQRIEAIAEAEY